MEAQVKADHEDAQAAVAKACKAVAACGAADDPGGSGAAATKKAQYRTTSALHRSCREEEAEIQVEYSRCTADVLASRSVKEAECNSLELIKAKVGNEAAHQQVVKRAPGEGAEAYMERLSKYFCGGKGNGDGMLEQLKRASHRCEAATAAHRAASAACAGKTSGWSLKREACDDLQDQMDGAACEAAVLMRAGCDGSGSCVKSRTKAFEATEARARKDEFARQENWRSVKRMSCLLRLLDDGYIGDPEIHECKHEVIDVSHLEIDYACDLPKEGGKPDACSAAQLYPGTQEYYRQELEGLPAGAPGKPVKACLGMPSEWVLLLSSDLSTPSLGDFSSGEEVGSLKTALSQDYRAALTGAFMQEKGMFGLKVSTASGHEEIVSEMVDTPSAFDNPCMDCECGGKKLGPSLWWLAGGPGDCQGSSDFGLTRQPSVEATCGASDPKQHHWGHFRAGNGTGVYQFGGECLGEAKWKERFYFWGKFPPPAEEGVLALPGWVLLLSSDLSSKSGLGDFSSGKQVGSLKTAAREDYRIGMTGAELQARKLRSIRVQTKSGYDEVISTSVDQASNLDHPCATCDCGGKPIGGGLWWVGGFGACHGSSHFGLMRTNNIHVACGVSDAGNFHWGHFHRLGISTGIYQFGGECINEVEWKERFYIWGRFQP